MNTVLDPTNVTGDGVSLYIKVNIQYKIRSDLKLDSQKFESIFIEVDRNIFSSHCNIINGVIYRPPNTDVTCFLQSVGYLLNKIQREKICYYNG